MDEFQVKINQEQLEANIRYYTYKDRTPILLNDEKNKIYLIGRDGKNIKIFKEMIGVELIIDDTPKKVFLKGEENKVIIAKQVLENMIGDNIFDRDKILELVKLYS